MRFIPGGPSLPDELLTARDAGQVLFFCGAGVSQAQAHLPNFLALAEKVLALLGSALDSPARRLFNSARPLSSGGMHSGQVAVDRIFGLLEHEFEPAEVREAVAISLKPDPGCSLTPHRTLLDLSRTRSGVPRLVTTNFDLLFEECEPGIESSNPPNLPDPRRPLDFRGIVHIHGCVDGGYHRARNDEFVLSSADFGHAYLSDGWATRYIQALLERFRIVFVGYSAEDPPVQYLLEAINRFAKTDRAIYAFQGGSSDEAVAQWWQKGVEAIAYDSADGHAALWRTLSGWSDRARDVDGWHERLIASAGRGPLLMAPHERGMIAHLASSTAGSRRLVTATIPLPADWLFVFDRQARYGPPARTDPSNPLEERFDPFEAFGLDSDPLPAAPDPEDIYPKRSIPTEAWDAFDSTPFDRRNLPVTATSQIRGDRSEEASILSGRLLDLCIWITRIADQPGTLWWAGGQSHLHPEIQNRIEWALLREPDRFTPAIRHGWRMLLASWKEGNADPDLRRHTIEAQTKLEGWSPALVREAISLYMPKLTAKRSGRTKAPDVHPDLATEDILTFDVEYPRPYAPLNIPTDRLEYGVRIFRQLLEYAVQIEREVSGHDSLYFDTTRPDDGQSLDENGYGLTGHLVTFTNMLVRLAAVDFRSARAEVAQWFGIGSSMFTRLRVWASGRSELTTPEEAIETFLGLDNESFWGSLQERDLLFAIRDRWTDIPPSLISKVEARICEGHVPWGDGRSDREELIAYHRLNRIHWLSSQGVKFSFDYDSTIAALRMASTDWTEEAASYTARPHVSKIQSIETDTDARVLVDLPICEVLHVANAHNEHDFISAVRQLPFTGLVAARPVRALRALTDAAKRGVPASWAWASLLSSQSEASRSSRMLSQIGRRLARLPSNEFAEIAHAVSDWLHERTEALLDQCPDVFGLVWDSLVAAMTVVVDAKKFHRPKRGWVDESINSPAGKMTEALFKDPAAKTFEPSAGLPPLWRHRLGQLMELPEDHCFHALAIITSRLTWLYHIDSPWVDKHLLPLADDTGDGGQAFWDGFISAARTPQPPLYRQLKAHLISLARHTGLRPGYTRVLAGILLAGWGGNDQAAEPKRPVSDTEMREILIHAEDDFRVQVLWYLNHWASDTAEKWAEHLVPFLTHVWPRQRAVRTARTSEALTNLALGLPERFPELVEAILPNLGQIRGSALLTNGLLDGNACLVGRHPKLLLDVLWAVLAEDPANWPYQTGNLLSDLVEQPATSADPRLVELRRREQQR